MSGLKQQPRLAYSQPEALCRTLVFRWGALLKLTDVNETHIIGGITYASARETTLAEIRQAHAHATQTKAYASGSPGVSGVSMVKYRDKEVNYQGRLLVRKQDVTTDDREGAVRDAVESHFATAKTHSALALSLHYTYPANNRSSGHTLGMFRSSGGLGKRGVSARFFDPNVGTWRFGGATAMLDFYENDWLTNFLAGTIKQDPGHPGLRTRELTYFRLVAIERG